ncbi:MAG: magnesium/cobalt transporter CorA [Caldilineales bacterium]|nr:magnesium/cobalt transporter CorA [Caldilineales bacterium]
MKHPLFPSRRHKMGMPPGSLVYVGERQAEKTSIHLTEYSESNQPFCDIVTDLQVLRNAQISPSASWVTVTGLNDAETIGQIAEIFQVPPLLAEDILNTDQRPKLQETEGNLFLIFKVFGWQEEGEIITRDQITLVVGSNFLLSLLEGDDGFLEPVRQRIEQGQGRLRKEGIDYLLYAITDIIVDHYFLVLEKLGGQIEALEEEISVEPTPQTLQHVYKVKREILLMQRGIWPAREVLGDLLRHESPLIGRAAETYLRDVYEHVIQVIDMLETLRELTTGMQDLYLSSLSYRMNEIMKVLTVIATIFIPLTFITSLYGMNFRFMPEIGWRWGYAFVWVLIVLVAGGLLLYFRRKRWV